MRSYIHLSKGMFLLFARVESTFRSYNLSESYEY
jgi:hypothetical protein